MVALGTITDRLKDYFDIWLLSQQVPVDGAILVEAFQSTFRRRSTSLPLEIPLALTDEFAAQRQPDWERFLNRSRLSSLEYPSFDEVVSQLRLFLWPVVQAAEKNAPFEKHWENGGPWMSKAR